MTKAVQQMASKGFGGSQTETSKNAREFMLAFKEYLLANEDLKDVHQFFSSHLSELNNLLLSSLPLIFRDLTRNKKPQELYQIAAVFGNFGSSLRDFPLGNQAHNVELSIVALQLSLKVFTRNFFHENWATVQNNLGNAYNARIQGERANNLEKAISAFNSALQVYTRDAFPEKWAMTQNNLGIAYCNRIRGERADNLEKAISAFELALQVRTREAFPKYWSDTQNNLGLAYWNRIRGERADNIELAITYYELALQGITPDSFPKNWSDTQNNLGLAYWNRIKGNRADNIELAITYYGLALQTSTPDSFPEDWARTQHNLAKTYRDRISGDRSENLEQAIYIFNQAAQVFTRKSFPEKWSINQANLAESLIKRAELTNNCNDLDTAIDILKEAIELAVIGSPDYIDTQYRLGIALSRRYEHTKNAAELEQAMQAYKIALDAISPEHYARKQIWQALPSTQVILGSRLVHDGEWQEGLQMLLNSLTQLSTGDDQLAHANALYQTGRAYEIMSDLDKARLYYRDALRLYDHLNYALGTTQSRAGLGSVLVSQGHLEKGISELAQAHEGYLRLKEPEKAHETDNIYQAAQRALERQATEVYA
jgi:tetratricopeptide (TPR) repeat protein